MTYTIIVTSEQAAVWNDYYDTGPPLTLLFPVDEQPERTRQGASEYIAYNGREYALPGLHSDTDLHRALLAAFCEKHGNGNEEWQERRGGKWVDIDGPLSVGDRVELQRPYLHPHRRPATVVGEPLAPATITGLHAGTLRDLFNSKTPTHTLSDWQTQYPDDPYDPDRWVVAVEVTA